MFNKEKEHEGEVHESPKPKERTAYEDSWYRSLKALADMRPSEDDEEASVPED